MKIEKAGTGILLAILLSFNAMALDECLSGQFKIVDREHTGVNIFFQDNGVAYGQWFGLIPTNGSVRAGLPTWSQLFGEHYPYLNVNTPVAELSIDIAWLESEMWEEWDANIGRQGRAYLYPLATYGTFPVITFPNENIDTRFFTLEYSLLIGSDGKLCVGTCSGELILERVTQPVNCD